MIPVHLGTSEEVGVRRNQTHGLCRPLPTAIWAAALIHQPVFSALVSRARSAGI
jgi:hypothetical protein